MQEKTITLTESEYLSLRGTKKTRAEKHEVDIIPGEIWKVIQGTDGLYSVSNLGRLRKTYETKIGELRDYIMACPKRTSGCTVRLSMSPNHQRNTYLHTLIMETFCPLPEGTRMVVIHEDCNTENNRLDNLRWGTHSEALLHRKQCKPENPKLKTKNYISKSGKRKVKSVWFSNGDLEKIKQLKQEGHSQAAIAKLIGCSQTYVCKVLTGKLRND